jgi:protein-tyrosine phosphatase
VFRKLVSDAGLADRIAVASAGTGNWHLGEPPDDRAQHHARRRGYELSDLRARQVTAQDIVEADLVFAMDRENLLALKRMAPARHESKVQLFLDFAPGQPVREVPDPYYSGDSGFEQVLDLVEEASRNLLAHLKART